MYINHILPQYNNGYNAALIDKTARLESIAGPKIVLLGNSNVSFGFDSSRIENAFDMPVVNMGLQGGQGSAFHEEMAKINVCKGDIYILCHSQFADNDTIIEPMAVWTALENNYHLWKLVRKKDIPVLIKTFPVYLKYCLSYYASGTGNADPGGVYSRNSFNQYGDIQKFREGNYIFEEIVDVPVIQDMTIERINKLNAWLKAKGATLLVAAYPIGNGELTVDASEFISFQEELKGKLDPAVISNYVDYMFDYTYFYDTYLHLSTDGARLRTEQLISDIQNWEKSSQDAAIDLDIYEDIMNDVSLSHITDIFEYLDALKKGADRYLIFISAKEEAAAALDKNLIDSLRTLKLDVLLENQKEASYLAILNGTEITERAGYEQLDISGNTGEISYRLLSGGLKNGNISSVLIDEKEYSRNSRGLNIVVYSIETKRILDTVTFDTHSQSLEANRSIKIDPESDGPNN